MLECGGGKSGANGGGEVTAGGRRDEVRRSLFNRQPSACVACENEVPWGLVYGDVLWTRQ